LIILGAGGLLICILPISRAIRVVSRIPGYRETETTNKLLRGAGFRHPDEAKIKWISLLLGWTIVGWLVAAVMATRKREVEIDQAMAELIKNPTPDPVVAPEGPSERQVMRDQAKTEKARLKAEKIRQAAEKAAMEMAEKNRVTETTFDRFKGQLDVRGKNPINGINLVYRKNTATGEEKLWIYIVVDSEAPKIDDAARGYSGDGLLDFNGSLFMILDGVREKIDYERTDKRRYMETVASKGDGVLMHALKLGISTSVRNSLGKGSLGWVVGRRAYVAMRKYDTRTNVHHVVEHAQGVMTLDHVAKIAGASKIEMRLNQIELPPEDCAEFILFAKSFREELLMESAKQY
jgi:hypothetical protein